MKLPIFGALAYLVLTLSPFRAAAHQPEPAYPAGDFMLQTAQGDSLQLSSSTRARSAAKFLDHVVQTVPGRDAGSKQATRKI